MAGWLDRLTGRKAGGEEQDVEREEFQQDDDQEETGEEQPEDPLTDLDDETREIAEAYATRRVETERGKAREALRSRGLDVGDDYQPVIADPAKVTGWLGVPAPRQDAQQAPAQPPAQPPDEELGVPPDASYDPQGFSEWLRKRDDRLLKGVNERLEQIAQRQVQTEAQSVATAQIAQALQTHSPALAHILEHPDFEASYRAQLQLFPREHWSDPRVMAAIAGMVQPYLDPARQPQPQQRGRDVQGRVAESAGDRAAAMRAGRVQLSPTADVSGGQPARRYDEEERRVMQMGGFNPDQWEAAADPEGNELRRLRARERAREGNRPPRPDPWRGTR